MGIMVYSLFWVMQDLYHQPYHSKVNLFWAEVLSPEDGDPCALLWFEDFRVLGFRV